MLPLYFWFWTDQPIFANPYLVAMWVAFIALLMVSSVATFSWGSLRLRRTIRFEAIAGVVLLGAALVSAALAYAERDLRRLSGDHPVQRRQLCPGSGGSALAAVCRKRGRRPAPDGDAAFGQRELRQGREGRLDMPRARRTIRCHCGATVTAITPAAVANAPENTRTLTTATIGPTPWQARAACG